MILKMFFKIDGYDNVKHQVSYEINLIDKNASELTLWIDRIVRELVEGEVVKTSTQPVQCVCILKSDLKRLAKAI